MTALRAMTSSHLSLKRSEVIERSEVIKRSGVIKAQKAQHD
jgi:hypothetical protein